jgi:hypothetical protein
MEVGAQCHALAALPLGRTRHQLYRRLVRPQGRSERVQKISPLLEFDPWTVQPVASCYTDCAIPAHGFCEFWSFHNGVLKDSGLLGCDVQCCVSTAWCFWGMSYLNLQQHEPLNPVKQCHIPECWNRLWILSALYTLFFICYKILVQAVLNVDPKFWYKQSFCLLFTQNSDTGSPLVYCWPEILLQSVLFIVDPKFCYKQFLMLTKNSGASSPFVCCSPRIQV